MKRFKMAAMVIATLAGTVGYAAAQGYGDRDDDRYYDRDDRRYDDQRYADRDDYRYDNRNDRYDNRYDGFRRGIHEAREFGYRDGAQVGREDVWNRKRFNPKPRGRYDDADHGYRREYGNKHEYREHYTEAYREGYESQFRGGGYYR
jgi:hypothetical protein